MPRQEQQHPTTTVILCTSPPPDTMTIFRDDAPNVAGAVIVLGALALITYGLRAYTRITRKAWGMEDWLMTIALAPFIALLTGCIGGAFNGVGVHISTLKEPQNQIYQVLGQKYFLLFEIGYCTAIIPIKLSISYLLIRVAEGQRRYIYTQYGLMTMFTLMNVIALIFIVTNCIPAAAAWDPTLLEKGGHCQPAHVLTDVYYACTTVNIFTDWVTALMPVPLLWHVQLNRQTKASILGLMSLGVFASLSACIRLKYTINLTNSTDFLYAIANILIWGFAENAMGMTVGNIATLRPLFRSLRDRSGGSASRGKRSQGYQLSYEIGDKSTDDRYFSTSTQVQSMHQRRRDSELSDESQQQILENGRGPKDNAGITVSHQVNIAYE